MFRCGAAVLGLIVAIRRGEADRVFRWVIHCALLIALALLPQRAGATMAPVGHAFAGHARAGCPCRNGAGRWHGQPSSSINVASRVVRGFDSLNRVQHVKEGIRTHGTNYYEGPSRLVRRDMGIPNNTVPNPGATAATRFTLEYDGIRGTLNPVDDHGFRQIKRTTHVNVATGAVLDDRTYTWDENQNMRSRRDERAAGKRTDVYTYDSAARVVRSGKTEGGSTNETVYTLDAAGNRTAVSGGSMPGSYTMSALTPPADEQMHQYTASPGGRSYTYDHNGNRTARTSPGGTVPMLYDYAGRLVQYGGALDLRRDYCAYDALGRRIKTWSSHILGQPGEYYYSGDQLVSEFNLAGQAFFRSFVYSGAYIDEPLSMRQSPEGDDLYMHADANYSVSVLSASDGSALYRYAYGDFGEVGITNEQAVPPVVVPRSPNPFLFTGRWYDDFPGLYDYRTRRYDPAIGRFTSRDTIGLWGDAANLGNPNTYVGNNPWSGVDPYGLYNETLGWRETGWGWIADGFVNSVAELMPDPSASRRNVIESAERAGNIRLSGTERFAHGIGAVSHSIAAVTDFVPGAGAARKKATKCVQNGFDRLLSHQGDSVFALSPKIDDAVQDAAGALVRVKLGKFLEGEDVVEAAKHAKEVGRVTGTVDRAGAKARRAERLKHRSTVPGMDRDEFPPAAIRPDDPSKVSIKPIEPSHNRRSGRRLRDELPPDGTPVEIDP